MTAELKQLEGLGRLLKAAGVKPAGAEQMIRAYLDSLHDETRYQHAEIVQTARTIEEELVELRHSHGFAMSEIRMATELMRREVEVTSVAFAGTLRRVKAAVVILVLLQIAILVVLMLPFAQNIGLPDRDAKSAVVQPSKEAGAPAREATGETKS